MEIKTEPLKKITIIFEDEKESHKFGHFLGETFGYTCQGLTNEEIKKGKDFVFDLYKALSR